MTPLGSQTVTSVTEQANSFFSNMITQQGGDQQAALAAGADVSALKVEMIHTSKRIRLMLSSRLGSKHSNSLLM